MFIDQETLKRINIYASYKGRSKLNTPEIRAAVGVIEIPDPVRGDDNYNYNQEIDDPPYLIVTPKSPEQIAEYEARITELAAIRQLHIDAKATAMYAAIQTATLAQINSWINTHFPTLNDEQRALLKVLSAAAGAYLREKEKERDVA